MGRNGLRLPEFKNEIKKTYLLSDTSRADLAFSETNGVRVMTVPRAGQNAMANVAVVEIAGDRVER